MDKDITIKRSSDLDVSPPRQLLLDLN